uniref:HD protein 6 n=1 Tax=Auricularia cornea TaxID=1238391 RepID=A0A8K2AUU3_9AGAM|nr:HD protein 6 [Auricularia cornea]
MPAQLTTPAPTSASSYLAVPTPEARWAAIEQELHGLKLIDEYWRQTDVRTPQYDAEAVRHLHARRGVRRHRRALCARGASPATSVVLGVVLMTAAQTRMVLSNLAARHRARLASMPPPPPTVRTNASRDPRRRLPSPPDVSNDGGVARSHARRAPIVAKPYQRSTARKQKKVEDVEDVPPAIAASVRTAQADERAQVQQVVEPVAGDVSLDDLCELFSSTTLSAAAHAPSHPARAGAQPSTPKSTRTLAPPPAPFSSRICGKPAPAPAPSNPLDRSGPLSVYYPRPALVHFSSLRFPLSLFAFAFPAVHPHLVPRFSLSHAYLHLLPSPHSRPSSSKVARGVTAGRLGAAHGLTRDPGSAPWQLSPPRPTLVAAAVRRALPPAFEAAPNRRPRPSCAVTGRTTAIRTGRRLASCASRGARKDDGHLLSGRRPAAILAPVVLLCQAVPRLATVRVAGVARNPRAAATGRGCSQWTPAPAIRPAATVAVVKRARKDYSALPRVYARRAACAHRLPLPTGARARQRRQRRPRRRSRWPAVLVRIADGRSARRAAASFVPPRPVSPSIPANLVDHHPSAPVVPCFDAPRPARVKPGSGRGSNSRFFFRSRATPLPSREPLPVCPRGPARPYAHRPRAQPLAMPALRAHDAAATSATATTTATTGKRTRRRVGPEQLKALENAYDENPYPDETTRDALAARVQMEPKAVSVWFQNKRQAERKQSLHAATTAANAGLGPPPVAIAHPGRRRQRVVSPGNGANAALKSGANAALKTGASATSKKGASAEKVQDEEEEEIDELADDSDGDWDATPPGTVTSASRSASANSSRAGSVRPVPRLSGSGSGVGSGSGSGSKSGSKSGSVSTVGSASKVGSGSGPGSKAASASAKATLARSASVSTLPAAAKAPLPRTTSLSDMTAQHKALELARASALAEMPREPPHPPQSGPTGVVYHVYPMPPGGYYPAYGMGMGMYGYGYGMGMGMGMGYYDPSAWGSAQPVPPTPVLAEKEREPISRTPSLASSSTTLISRTPSTSTMMSRTPSLASTLGGSSPSVDVEEHAETERTPTPPKKRPRQLYDLMASSSPPPAPEPEPRRRRTLEWACAKERGGGEVDAQDALRKAQQLKERREREARRAQEEDDTAMAALMLVGLRGG